MKRKQPIEEPCRSPATSLPGVIRESGILYIGQNDTLYYILLYYIILFRKTYFFLPFLCLSSVTHG